MCSKGEFREEGREDLAVPKQTCPMSWCPAGFCHQEGRREFPLTSAKPQNCWDKLPASSALGRGVSWEFWGLAGCTGLAPKHGSTTLECCPTCCPASCQGQGLPSLSRPKMKSPVEGVTLPLPQPLLQSAWGMLFLLAGKFPGSELTTSFTLNKVIHQYPHTNAQPLLVHAAARVAQ